MQVTVCNKDLTGNLVSFLEFIDMKSIGISFFALVYAINQVVMVFFLFSVPLEIAFICNVHNVFICIYFFWSQ